jgi:xanthine dehydrogenase accessory factor
MEFSWEKLLELLKTEKELILYTIIEKRGSAPRGVGTSMIVLKDGTIYGTIGGGIVENELIEETKNYLSLKKNLIIEKNFTGDAVICGGRVKILAEYFSENDIDFIEEIIKQYNEKSEVYLIRDLTNFRRFISDVVEKSEEFYSQRIVAKPILYIFGGGHIAVPLVEIAALCEFKIILFDNRKEYAAKDRFPKADEVIYTDFQNVNEYNINFSNNTYFVLITSEHAHDEIVLEQLLGHKYRYLGMIGSKKRVGSVKDRLIKKGFNKDEIQNIYAPIGITINSETPAEIAVSIIGEIIKVKNA